MSEPGTLTKLFSASKPEPKKGFVDNDVWIRRYRNALEDEVLRLDAINKELLEACESALVHLPYQQYFRDVREQLKAAITKARGES